MKEFEYKVGDIVYCYKSRYQIDILMHSIGKCYKIKYISYHEDEYIYVNLETEGKTIWNDYLMVFRYDIESPYNFYDYFLTKHQYRKLKLEKLHERI